MKPTNSVQGYQKVHHCAGTLGINSETGPWSTTAIKAEAKRLVAWGIEKRLISIRAKPAEIGRAHV